jgi:hypothetical protein
MFTKTTFRSWSAMKDINAHRLLEHFSPQIGAIQASDPTLRHFTVKTMDPSHDFEEFLRLGEGSTVRITAAKLVCFSALSLSLANREFGNCLFRGFEYDPKIDSFCDRFGCLVWVNSSLNWQLFLMHHRSSIMKMHFTNLSEIAIVLIHVIPISLKRFDLNM